MTKPDILDEGGEQKIIDLVNAKSHKLTLGYYIVRNRGLKELGSTIAERTAKELEFFKSPRWNALDSGRVGVQSLRLRLQSLLNDMIEREFPKIRSQIESRLDGERNLLNGLGSERTSPEQQRMFLDGIAIQFQAISNDAMDRINHRHEILSKGTDLRLPTLVSKACDQLADDFKAHETTGADREPTSPLPFTSAGLFQPASPAIKTPLTRTGLASSTKAVTAIYPELANLSIYKDDDRSTDNPSAGFTRSWIESEYRASQGYEVELVDTSTLKLLWCKQSQAWTGISRRFLKEVIAMVHSFILRLLHKVCPDNRTRASLKALLLDEMIKRYNRAIDAVHHILAVERSGKLITKNRYFADTLSKNRSQLKGGNPDLVVDELQAVLGVYHEVARKRTVDNIIQNVDYFLLSGKQSPLSILTTGFVSQMTTKQLERCAGEDEASKSKRVELKELIKNLEKGMDVIRNE